MISRRQFIKLTSSTAGLLVSGCQTKLIKSTSAHVVVIGGGFGGATAAKTIKKLDPSIRVTLIEPKSHYVTCPGSNWVLAGFKSLKSLAVSYQQLSKKYDIKLIHDKVTFINPDKRSVTLSTGNTINYDRLIVSPGIDFRWDAIDGHNQSSTDLIPHAWKAGVQTEILNNQLQNMPDGGKVIICAPPNPFRCPPGPYERASLIAHYLKRYKPKSKIIILDAKTQFSKQSLFMEGWRKHYGFGSSNSLIEWHSIPDNPVVKIDIKNKRVETDFGDIFNADVLNYIPAQKAAHIAQSSGLCNDSGWCPVNHKTSESTLYQNIHVIGDASIQSPIPKSAFAANAEAKVCAFAVISLLKEIDMIDPVWINTCYSLITADQGISVAMVYKLNPQGKITKVKGAGGITPNSKEETLSLEANYAKQWLPNIIGDSFT